MTMHAEINRDNDSINELNRSPRFARRLTFLALLLGLGFEILFYGHRIGISIFLMSVLVAAGLLASAAIRRKKPAPESLLLLMVIGFFSAMTMVRLEPMTLFINLVITLALFALTLRTFFSGQIFRFTWWDFSLAFIGAPIEAWVRPWSLLAIAQESSFKSGARRNTFLALVRGLLIALPIFVLLLGLLTSADLIFAERVEAALRWVNLKRIAEYAGRTLVVILSTLFFLGSLVIAFRSASARAPDKRGIFKPFLGSIEAFVVLGSVDLLFSSFVVFQFVYLFGGSANIFEAGYTYAEYARRGFFELVAVGVLSIGLILLLAIWTRRDEKRARNLFFALSSLLVLEVGVILVSALTRLLLYENAFGFTRLRTYTHVFIPWMGILLAVFLFLLLRQKLRYLPQIVIACGLGFALSLNLINVDSFIVGQNIARFEVSGRIDLDYLFSLSEDAIPRLIQFIDQAPGDIQDRLLAELACWKLQIDDFREDHSWPSSHRSRSIAFGLMKEFEEDFEQYEITYEQWGYWLVEFHGDRTGCAHQAWIR